MTLYKTNVDNFGKRVLKLFYPYLIIFGLLLFLPLLDFNGNKFIILIWVIILLSIIIMMLISSYNWSLNQVTSLSFRDNFFEVEFISKNIKKSCSIHKTNINTTLKWQGGRPRILKLSLFDNGLKVADFYSGGRQKLEEALEEIAFKIDKCKNTIR